MSDGKMTDEEAEKAAQEEIERQRREWDEKTK